MRPTLPPVALFALALLGGCHDAASPPRAQRGSGTDAPGAASQPAPGGASGEAPEGAPQAAAAPPAAFAPCLSCHPVTRGARGAGPTLAGIMGSKAGAVPDYPFSPALRHSGIVWTPQTLDTWLQGPMQMVPGTRMVMPVPDPARRRAIIAYLATLD